MGPFSMFVMGVSAPVLLLVDSNCGCVAQVPECLSVPVML